ncbi:tudor domain-containing 6-like [Nerophis ophidion]|uniref:tudor domain-containing 6-like n=1 Tax=Nerophis ophidion TaxID=159077 RepID=UPI002ADFF558|nr:tudor domain-containing 6-like [Nerophis ophidion]XP_061752300.1 tudor domain-containing 6-like [Nerophis ophidion]
MCSIPGLPTPGSEVTVDINRVNPNPKCGLMELWVHMNVGRKHAYQQMNEHIQLPQRLFCGSEGEAGDLCLVCISAKWHRARIVSIQDEACHVFLIDQGRPHVSGWDALAWDQSDCFLLPPEIESCILANIIALEENWPEKAANFLRSLPGKTMSGVVQHVLMPDRTILLDVPFISKQMCTLGAARKLPVEEFRDVLLKCLHPPKENSPITCNVTQMSLNNGVPLDNTNQYFYPELLCGVFETVIVTEVIDPHKVFCKLLIYSQALKTLSEEMQLYYDKFSDPREEKPKTCGEPCATRGENYKWHRSLLKQNIRNGDALVEVMHVDEGKTEFVPVGCIIPLQKKFLRMPVVTYRFSLYGVVGGGTGWMENHIKYLKSLLLNNTFVVRLEKHRTCDDAYIVTLYNTNGTCMNTCFLEKAELFLATTTERPLDIQIEPPSALNTEDEPGVDFLNLVDVDDRLEKETLASAKNGPVDNQQDSGPSDRDDSEHPQPLLLTSKDCLTSEVKHVHQDDLLCVGSTVNVKVSCIQGPHKFWCQKTENEETLRVLMEGLQDQYASIHPPSIVESPCVARNPDNGMWYRAKIITSGHFVEVDVHFLDYGATQRVPLRDVCHIDPAFLQLDVHAFQCRLDNPNTPSDSPWNNTASLEFQKFVESGKSEIKCTIKDIISDEEGQLVNVVDLEMSAQSACKLLAQKCTQALPVVPVNTYSYFTYNMQVGRKEKVWVTSSESVHHFFCQLNRNYHLFEEVKAEVKKVIGKSQCGDRDPIGINTACLARYTDKEWYRGQVVKMSPNPEVLFVDYGDTLSVNESDILPLSASASVVKSVPVLAIPLGLFGVPVDVPEEVNQWFADHAIGTNLTIFVAATSDGGKLLVELFEGLLNINVMVREKMVNAKQQAMTERIVPASQEVPKEAALQDTNFLREELVFVSKPQEMVEQNKQQRSNGTQQPNTTLATTLKSDPQKTLGDELLNSTIHKEEMLQTSQPNTAVTQNCPPECPERLNSFTYKMPNVSPYCTEVYASCIAGPNYFWCQFANTEDLNAVSTLAQTVGESLQVTTPPEILNPGCPCLALFSDDSQWYRAQVVRRTNNMVSVLFVDFGNESEIEIKYVRSLPMSLIEYAPQAFLCSLDGFDESKGSWDDQVYDDIYTLLVDRPLRVTMLKVQEHSELSLPQHLVKIECGNTNVNEAMQKYWKANIFTESEIERAQEATPPKPIESNVIPINENARTCSYKHPNVTLNKMEEVYASCIVEPNFFWCQFTNTDDLDKVVSLAQEEGRAELDLTFSETFGPSTLCLALFSTDNQWYRALITSKEGNRVHVVFIDYGNEADLAHQNVRPLPQSLQDFAPQAFLCTLNGFNDSKGSWEDNAYDDFYNLLVDKPLRVTVSHVKDHPETELPYHAVEVECEGVSVNAAMQKYWKPTTGGHLTTPTGESSRNGPRQTSTPTVNVNVATYKKPDISKNEPEVVYASCLVDPNFFWCQFGNTQVLEQLSALAQEAGQAKPDENFPESLLPGSPCLAVYPMDHNWYRAQVISRVDDNFHVVFIDYGNNSHVNTKDVRPLAPGLLEFAPQAFLCSLNRFEAAKGSWDKGACKEFFSLLADKPLKVTVFHVEDIAKIALPQYAVEVECEGVNVNEIMEKYCNKKG